MAKNKKSRNIDRWVRRHQNKHLCGCGCGEFIEIRREHYRKSVGIPKFIPGHNLQKKEVVEEVQEEEKPSLWDKLSPEEKQRRLNQLKNFGSGEENPAWKGGRRSDENGYVQIRMPDHPFAKDGYVYEHRLVVEERTKKYDPNNEFLVEVGGEKYLHPKSVVHHIDEVKTNNNVGKGQYDIGNLMLLENQTAHAFIHYSPLPMRERLRRIAAKVYHSGELSPEEAELVKAKERDIRWQKIIDSLAPQNPGKTC